MIPPFDENGNLPPGVHPTTMAEVAARFGSECELRRVQMQSLCWLVEIALRAGGQKLIINGSFVTDISEPNDVDCVLLLDPAVCKDQSALDELEQGLPFIQIYVVEKAGYDYFVTQFYATDRADQPKGMLEVAL